MIRFLTLLLIAACSSPHASTSNTCATTSDCKRGERCQNGRCQAAGGTCNDVQDCGGGQNCCGGTCTTTDCCTLDRDCGAGFCNNGLCDPGERPSCSIDTPCASGRCLLSTQQCVECLYADDCPEASLLCSSEHRCTPGLDTCTASSCATTGEICAPEDGACRDCLGNGECGSKICDDGRCRACTQADDCGLGRVCDNGACVGDATTPCQSNADCGDRVCKLVGDELQCEACLLSNECGNGRTCASGRCSATAPNCDADNDCGPPASVCVAGLCSAGCGSSGCASGQTCSSQTGRCVVTSTGSGDLGEACVSHTGCASGVCWPYVTDGGDEAAFCSQTCTRQDDCPSDFVCFDLGDSAFCAPKTMLEGDLSSSAGDACTTDYIDGDCESYLCNPDTNVCLQTCGNNADCSTNDVPGGSACFAWRFGSGSNTSFASVCDPPNTSLLAAGSACSLGSHGACRSGFCAQTPDFTVSSRCAGLCCTPSDCGPGASVCKPIALWDGVYDSSEPYGYQKICLWREYAGTKNAGDVCSSDAECKSEICAAGPSGTKRCTHTCCTNGDCAGYSWAQGCRPPFPGSDIVADTNASAMARSLGRDSGFGIVSAVAPLCVPK